MDGEKVCFNCGAAKLYRDAMPFRTAVSSTVIPICHDCVSRAVVVGDKPDTQYIVYLPQPHQQPFHESNSPNLLALGTRGTGKSTTLRWDVIIRCLMFPGFKALIIRRTMQDLRKSHLNFIGAEMELLGGPREGYIYRQTTFDAKFPNGSMIQFSHCETMKDVLNYLSSEWDYIGFDELSTFTLEMFLQISAAARAPVTAPYIALVRGCSNPLGPGAPWMKQWFIDQDVNLGDYPDYLPTDFEMQFSTLDDNKYVNRREYEKRLKTLPDHVRRAWLLGEFVIEGAYFTDFRRRNDAGEPWHVTQQMPSWKGQRLFDLSWISVYRAVDWGYWPDPAVCLWVVVLPNKRAVVFKERKWRRTLAKDVAAEIKRESEGMHVVETFADPSMFIKDGTAPFSIAEQFEQNGVPLTPCQNDRELYGYAIHEYLNTVIDGQPQLQIVEAACPELVRTFPLQQMDPLDARKIANGNDHYVITLAYFCMGQAPPSRSRDASDVPRWMRPKGRPRSIGVVHGYGSR